MSKVLQSYSESSNSLGRCWGAGGDNGHGKLHFYRQQCIVVVYTFLGFYFRSNRVQTGLPVYAICAVHVQQCPLVALLLLIELVEAVGGRGRGRRGRRRGRVSQQLVPFQ